MKMRKVTLFFIFSVCLLCAVYPAESRTDVNIGVGIAPPPVVIPAPPEVVLIPGTYVYFVPGIDVDILFYHGYWYRPYEGRWYRANRYNGPWVYLSPSRVPRPFLRLPHDYRHIEPGYHRIPHGDLRKNWRRWERERHWDREMRDNRGERGEHGRGRDRGRY